MSKKQNNSNNKMKNSSESNLNEDMHDFISKLNANSLDEINLKLSEFIATKNNNSNPNFHGL